MQGVGSDDPLSSHRIAECPAISIARPHGDEVSHTDPAYRGTREPWCHSDPDGMAAALEPGS